MLATNKWTEKRMNNQQLPANATELKLSFDDHIYLTNSVISSVNEFPCWEGYVSKVHLLHWEFA